MKMYEKLPTQIQERANSQFEQLKRDPWHGSLEFKRLFKNVWSVRVSDSYRACAVEKDDGVFEWFFIGTHDQYDTLLKKSR